MKSIKQRLLRRDTPPAQVTRNDDNTSVRIAISSELPVLMDVGTWEAPMMAWEILDHSPSSIDFTRFNNRPPFLVDHIPGTSTLAGSLVNISVDKDRVLRADVLFSRSDLGQTTKADIEDGHLHGISVGYQVLEYREEGWKDGYPVLRAVKWQPREASAVPIPADISVGVGRNVNDDTTYEVAIIPADTLESPAMPNTASRDESVTAPNEALSRSASDVTEEDDEDTTGTDTTESNDVVTEASEDAAEEATETPAEEVVEEAEERAASRDDDDDDEERTDSEPKPMQKASAVHLKSRNNEVAAIVQLATDYNLPQTTTAEFIQRGLSYDAVHSEISKMANAENTTPVSPITLSAKEEREFNLVEAYRTLTTGGPRSGLVFELSDEMAKTRKASSDKSFFIPTNVRFGTRADMTTTTSGGTNAIFAEPGASSIIELLRNRAKVISLGAKTLTVDAVGSIRFPKQSTTGNAFWRSEGSAASVNTLSLGSVTANQHTLTGFSRVSREFLHNSSYGANDLIVGDLVAAMAVQLDAAAISGSAANQPTGLLNLAGVGSYAGGTNGASGSFATVVGMKKVVTQANADTDSLKWLTTPNVEAAFRSTTKIAGGQYSDFIWEPENKIMGYDAAVSMNVPSNLAKGTGTNLSALILGDFTQMLFVEWGAVEVVYDPYSAAEFGLGRFITHLSCDMIVRHPESFVVCADIIA